MKFQRFFSISTGTLVLALGGGLVRASVVSNNTTNDLEVNFSGGNLRMGDELTLAVPMRAGGITVGRTSRTALDFDLHKLTDPGDTLPFSIANATPDDLVRTTQSFGLGEDDDGVSLYSSPPGGADFLGYSHFNDGTLTVMTNARYPVNIGSEIEAAPEPAPAILLGLGGLVAVGFALKRCLLPRR